jgi:hypothetical protein
MGTGMGPLPALLVATAESSWMRISISQVQAPKPSALRQWVSPEEVPAQVTRLVGGVEDDPHAGTVSSVEPEALKYLSAVCGIPEMMPVLVAFGRSDKSP